MSITGSAARLPLLLLCSVIIATLAQADGSQSTLAVVPLSVSPETALSRTLELGLDSRRKLGLLASSAEISSQSASLIIKTDDDENSGGEGDNDGGDGGGDDGGNDNGDPGTGGGKKSSGFPQWVIGFLLSFFGCTLSNLGVNMQKYAHNRLAQRVEAKGEGTSLVSDPMWILGLASIAVGSVADLVSFSFASMSLLAPLGAMTLVVNMFIAPVFLKETLSRRDIIVTMIILFGTVLSVVFGSKEETKYTLKELVALYGKPLFIGYAVVVVVYIGATLFYLRSLERKEKGHIPDSEGAGSASVAAVDGDVSSSKSQFVPPAQDDDSKLGDELALNRGESQIQRSAKELISRITHGKVANRHEKLTDDIETEMKTIDTTDGLTDHALSPDAFEPVIPDSNAAPEPSVVVADTQSLTHPTKVSRLSSAEAAFRAFAYPSLAGVFGAHSVLFAKSATEPVKATAAGNNQFNNPLAYFFVLFLIGMVYLQMKFLNLGLSKADALYVVPVYQVCWVVMNAVVGMTYFRDYRDMSGLAMFLFLLGIAITSFGVYLLSKRNIVNQHEELAEEILEPEEVEVEFAQEVPRFTPELATVSEDSPSTAPQSTTTTSAGASTPEHPSMRPRQRSVLVTRPRAGSRASPSSSPNASPIILGEGPRARTGSVAGAEATRARTGSVTATPPVQGRGRVLSIGAFHQIYLGDATTEALPSLALNVPTFETVTPVHDETGSAASPEVGPRQSVIGEFFSSIFGHRAPHTSEAEGTYDTLRSPSAAPAEHVAAVELMPPLQQHVPEHTAHSPPDAPTVEAPAGRSLGLRTHLHDAIADEDRERTAAAAWSEEANEI